MADRSLDSSAGFSAQEEKSGPEHSSAEPQAAHNSGHEHRHHAGIFIGGSHSGEENGFTFGGEYEFKFLQYFGAGGFVEVIGGDFDERAFGALLYLRPTAAWTIFTGPGGEKRFREEQLSVQSAEGTEEGMEFLRRAGLMYGIPVGRMKISPNVMVRVNTSSQEQPQWRKKVEVFIRNDASIPTVVGIERE